MKCPKCQINQKHKEGMSCKKCGYVFGLDPKKAPYVSDAAMHNLVDNLSGTGQYFFTFNQLYVEVHKLVLKCKKKGVKKVGSLLGAGLLAVIVFSILEGMLGMMWTVLILGFIVALAIWYVFRPVRVTHEEVMNLIDTYRRANPLDNLVDGKWFQREVSKEALKEELFQYVPERILIVENDELVDMLVRNRFHFDHKTAVVSANKYPNHVFTACQRFLEKKPDIPVHIIHELSREGRSLKDRLVSDRSWNLEGKQVKDLGIFADDVKDFKEPVWIPSGRPSDVLPKKSGASPVEQQIDNGMRMPVDLAPPRVLLGSLGVAVAGGLLLMSTALFAAQARQAASDAGGGFG
jgi:hypothetical protein